MGTISSRVKEQNNHFYFQKFQAERSGIYKDIKDFVYMVLKCCSTLEDKFGRHVVSQMFTKTSEKLQSLIKSLCLIHALYGYPDETATSMDENAVRTLVEELKVKDNDGEEKGLVHYCEMAADSEFWKFEFSNGTCSLENLLREPAYIFLEVVRNLFPNRRMVSSFGRGFLKTLPEMNCLKPAVWAQHTRKPNCYGVSLAVRSFVRPLYLYTKLSRLSKVEDGHPSCKDVKAFNMKRVNDCFRPPCVGCQCFFGLTSPPPFGNCAEYDVIGNVKPDLLETDEWQAFKSACQQHLKAFNTMLGMLREARYPYEQILKIYLENTMNSKILKYQWNPKEKDFQLTLENWLPPLPTGQTQEQLERQTRQVEAQVKTSDSGSVKELEEKRKELEEKRKELEEKMQELEEKMQSEQQEKQRIKYHSLLTPQEKQMEQQERDRERASVTESDGERLRRFLGQRSRAPKHIKEFLNMVLKYCWMMTSEGREKARMARAVKLKQELPTLLKSLCFIHALYCYPPANSDVDPANSDVDPANSDETGTKMPSNVVDKIVDKNAVKRLVEELKVNGKNLKMFCDEKTYEDIWQLELTSLESLPREPAHLFLEMVHHVSPNHKEASKRVLDCFKSLHRNFLKPTMLAQNTKNSKKNGVSLAVGHFIRPLYLCIKLLKLTKANNANNVHDANNGLDDATNGNDNVNDNVRAFLAEDETHDYPPCLTCQILFHGFGKNLNPIGNCAECDAAESKILNSLLSNNTCWKNVKSACQQHFEEFKKMVQQMSQADPSTTTEEIIKSYFKNTCDAKVLMFKWNSKSRGFDLAVPDWS